MSVPYIAGDPRDESSAPAFPGWRELVSILMERAWVGIGVALVVFAYFYLQLRRETPYYRSTAVLMVEAQAPRLLNYQDIMAFNARNIEYFNTIITVLHSQRMMEQALQTSGLADHPGFFPHHTTLAAKATAARRLVSITPVDRSRLIRISAEHPDPIIAGELANAMARSYIQQDLDDRMNASMQAVEWLRDRSVEYRDKLEQGLLELQRYREETESVSLEDDQNIVIAKLKALNNALTTAETERIAAETEWLAIRNQVADGVPLARVAAQLNDSGVSEALSRWRQQQQQVARLRQRYLPGYPEIQEAIEFEASLRTKFEEACEIAVHALQSRYELVKAREDRLREALREQEQEAFALDRKLVRYNDLRRNLEADQEIYKSMIARMKEASVAESLPAEIIRLAEEARPASVPFRPQPRRVLVRGGVIGVVLGLMAVGLLAYTDHRFRRTEEIERAMGVPVLATLPLIEGKTKHERGLVTHLNRTGEVAESFRTLRAGLQHNPMVKNAKILMITSAHPGEGKSLVAANLAVSFSQDNRRTLLIGADLRRPAFGEIFGEISLSKGLTDVLRGDCPWREAVLVNQLPNLDVLAAGGKTSHPSELLGDSRLKSLMAECREIYDRVVIDAPPLLGVSDSLILLSHADGVLFVVRYGVTHRLGAIHAMRRIGESATPCLGALMNGVDLRSMANSYYYRRYAGYGYHPDQVSNAPAVES